MFSRLPRHSRSARATVHVGGIDQRLAGIEGGVNNLDADIFRRAAVEREVHAAVADDGNGGEVGTEGSGKHGGMSD